MQHLRHSVAPWQGREVGGGRREVGAVIGGGSNANTSTIAHTKTSTNTNTDNVEWWELIWKEAESEKNRGGRIRGDVKVRGKNEEKAVGLGKEKEKEKE